MAEDVIFDYDFELVSIQINLQNIRFEFGPSKTGLAVAFNGSFDAIRSDANSQHETIEAWERLGDLRAIWRLIGVEMARIVMDRESFHLIFKDGTILQAKNGPYPEIVNVWGPFGDPDKIYLTRYPADLNVNPDGDTRDPVHQILQQDPIVLMPTIPRDE